jgi:7,8-dihydropterin-6-yl-methyl-4-(beta-D-ribofuranosyl)aminobenzene 5'-phosphate synthase
MAIRINEVDSLEVLTLQDNYIDMVAADGTEVVHRGAAKRGRGKGGSILAEHGFSALVTAKRGDSVRSILFDFGYSAHGAAYNAEVLGVDLSAAEALVLSHGHPDHLGGLSRLVEMVGKPGIEMVVHPGAFRKSRFARFGESRMEFPPFTREQVAALGLTLVEAEEPYPLLDGDLLFLGSIPRTTDFEKGAPNLFYTEDGVERRDDIADDSSLAAIVRGRGLVVVSGCAHSGIVNTVRQARSVTGEKRVYAIMGGFHLSGKAMEAQVDPTVDALKEFDPIHVAPTHCTGRSATMKIEKAMPDRFLLNMAGTRMIFSGQAHDRH